MNKSKLQSNLQAALLGQRDWMFAEVLNGIHCMSRARVYAVLNAVASSMDEGEIYCEVGTYQGGSLVSALLGNEARAIGIDNFAEFKETNNFDTTQGNLNKFGVAERAVLRDMSYQEFFTTVPDGFKIAVYNYDGEHNFPGQLAGLEMAWQYLGTGSIIVVDDYTYPEVTQAVNSFIAKYQKNIRTLFQFTPVVGLDETWWNGVCILEVV